MILKRRNFLVVAVAGLAAATPAVAQDIVASIIGQLRKQGFQSVLEERTLLGRVKIIATRQDGRREIIVNPRTGEILRDLWTPGAGGEATIQIIEDKSGNGGGSADDDEDGDDGEGGGGDDDDDDNDDDNDDDGESDESGDSSGSGSGGGDNDNDNDEDGDVD
jgi:hypothetical protein